MTAGRYQFGAVVVLTALLLTWGVIVLWRRYLDRRDGGRSLAADARGVGQRPSPVVTWLKSAPWRALAQRIRPSREAGQAEVPSLRFRADTQIVFGALLLAIAAQFRLRPGDLLEGLAAYGLAMGLLIWADYRLKPAAAAPLAYEAAWPSLQRLPRLGLLGTSTALCLWTAFNVSQDQGWLVDVTWMVSLVLWAGSVFYVTAWERPSAAALRQWWHKHGLEVLALVALAAVTLALGLYDAEVHPFPIANDEGEYGVSALHILSGAQKNLFNPAYGAVPAWSVLTRAVTIGIFGNTVFGLRSAASFEGAAAVVLLYLLGCELFDRKRAALAVGVFLTLPWQLQFTRLGIANSALFLYSILLVWLTFRALRLRRLADYLWIGLVSGGTLYCYAGTRALIGLPVGVLGFVALRQRDYLRKHLVHLGVAAVTLLVVALPVIFWYSSHMDVFGAQFNGHAILNNGWLKTEAATRPGGYPAVLLDQFQRTSLVYILTPSTGFFYPSSQPFLTGLGAVFFMLGIAYAVGHWKEPRYIALIAWLAGALIVGTFTDIPPASERLILSSGAVALLVVVGLCQFTELARQTLGVSAGLRNLVCGAVVVVLAFQGLTFYFIDYRVHDYFEDASNEITYEAGSYAATLGPNYRMYLIGNGSPQVLEDFANFHYLAPDAHATNFNTVTPETLAALPRNLGAFFMAVPSLKADLDRVVQLIPGGYLFQVQRRFHPDQVSYYGYAVSPVVMAGR